MKCFVLYTRIQKHTKGGPVLSSPSPRAPGSNGDLQHKVLNGILPVCCLLVSTISSNHLLTLLNVKSKEINKLDIPVVFGYIVATHSSDIRMFISYINIFYYYRYSNLSDPNQSSIYI